MNLTYAYNWKVEGLALTETETGPTAATAVFKAFSSLGGKIAHAFILTAAFALRKLHIDCWNTIN